MIKHAIKNILLMHPFQTTTSFCNVLTISGLFVQQLYGAKNWHIFDEFLESKPIDFVEAFEQIVDRMSQTVKGIHC